MKIVRYLRSFEYQYRKSVEKYNVKYNIFFRFFIFIKWYLSISNWDKNIIADDPWIVLFSIPFLKKKLGKSSIVFEYGSGGSTLFFAKRVKKIISVEHNIEWFEKINTIVKKKHRNVILNYIPATREHLVSDTDPSSPNSYFSSAEEYKGLSFFSYATMIDKYQDDYFDIIFIDGRARPSCLKHSIPKIKKGGYIILDDADRDYYLTNTSHLLHNFSIIDFPGPVNGLETFYRTLFFRKN